MAIVDFSGGSQSGSGGGGGGGDVENAVLYTAQSLNSTQKTQARTNIGAGTYSKPSGGIPASDLASGVVPDVSGLYTKPASGIPASDLADGVIPTVPVELSDLSDVDGTTPEDGQILGFDGTANKWGPINAPSGGGGSAENAVLYTSQSLSSSQKTQARTNIGAGTYSKPSGGIPASDMASAVQTSLSKADNAVKFDNANQGLSDQNKQNARTNIGAISANEGQVVHTGLNSPSNVLNPKEGDIFYKGPSEEQVYPTYTDTGGSFSSVRTYDVSSYTATAGIRVEFSVGAGVFSTYVNADNETVEFGPGETLPAGTKSVILEADMETPSADFYALTGPETIKEYYGGEWYDRERIAIQSLTTSEIDTIIASVV